MKTDIEIAQEAMLKPIKEVASQLGITEDELDFYGTITRSGGSTMCR